MQYSICINNKKLFYLLIYLIVHGHTIVLQMIGTQYLGTSPSLVWVQFRFCLMSYSWFSTTVSIDQREINMKLSVERKIFQGKQMINH